MRSSLGIDRGKTINLKGLFILYIVLHVVHCGPNVLLRRNYFGIGSYISSLVESGGVVWGKQRVSLSSFDSSSDWTVSITLLLIQITSGLFINFLVQAIQSRVPGSQIVLLEWIWILSKTCSVCQEWRLVGFWVHVNCRQLGDLPSFRLKRLWIHTKLKVFFPAIWLFFGVHSNSNLTIHYFSQSDNDKWNQFNHNSKSAYLNPI